MIQLNCLFPDTMEQSEQVRCSSSESDNFEKINSEDVQHNEDVSKFVVKIKKYKLGLEAAFPLIWSQS